MQATYVAILDNMGAILPMTSFQSLYINVNIFSKPYLVCYILESKPSGVEGCGLFSISYIESDVIE